MSIYVCFENNWLESYVEELNTICMCVRMNRVSRCVVRLQDGMARRKGE